MYLSNNGIFIMIVSKYRGHGVNSFIIDLQKYNFKFYCFEVPKNYYKFRSHEMEKRGEEYVFIIAIRNNEEYKNKYS